VGGLNAQAALGGVTVALTGMLAFVGFATSLVGGYLTGLLTVFMALYLTIDAPRMRDYLLVFWPRDRQPRVACLANEMGARLGHWAIGQAVLCVVIGRRRVAGIAVDRRTVRRLARPGLGTRRIRAWYWALPVGNPIHRARVHRLASDWRRGGGILARLESGGKNMASMEFSLVISRSERIIPSCGSVPAL
jgi:hypothetical protein